MSSRDWLQLLAWLFVPVVLLGIIGLSFRSNGTLGPSSLFTLIYLGGVVAAELAPMSSLSNQSRQHIRIALIIGFVLWLALVGNRIVVLLS